VTIKSYFTYFCKTSKQVDLVITVVVWALDDITKKNFCDYFEDTLVVDQKWSACN
jgi:hypothetical protein